MISFANTHQPPLFLNYTHSLNNTFSFHLKASANFWGFQVVPHRQLLFCHRIMPSVFKKKKGGSSYRQCTVWAHSCFLRMTCCDLRFPEISKTKTQIAFWPIFAPKTGRKFSWGIFNRSINLLFKLNILHCSILECQRVIIKSQTRRS